MFFKSQRQKDMITCLSDYNEGIRPEKEIMEEIDSLEFSDKEFEKFLAKNNFLPSYGVTVEKVRRIKDLEELIRMVNKNPSYTNIVIKELKRRECLYWAFEDNYLGEQEIPISIKAACVVDTLSSNDFDILDLDNLIIYLENLIGEREIKIESFTIDANLRKAIEIIIIKKATADYDFHILKDFCKSPILRLDQKSLLLDILVKLAPDIIELDNLLIDFYKSEDRKKIINGFLRFTDQNCYCPLFILQKMQCFDYDSFSEEAIENLENKIINNKTNQSYEYWFDVYYVARNDSELELFAYDKIHHKFTLKKLEEISSSDILKFF